MRRDYIDVNEETKAAEPRQMWIQLQIFFGSAPAKRKSGLRLRSRAQEPVSKLSHEMALAGLRSQELEPFHEKAPEPLFKKAPVSEFRAPFLTMEAPYLPLVTPCPILQQ